MKSIKKNKLSFKKKIKKIIIVKGTYRQNGMVSGLVDNFILGIKSKNNAADIEIVDLLKTKVEFCKGCSKCTRTKGNIGACPINDDVRRILPKMLECDCLVFATPIYELGPTALMKRFIERNLPTLSFGTGFPKARNKVRKDKIGVVILSSGAPYPLNVILGFTKYPMKILTYMAKLWSCEKVYSIKAGGMEAKNKTKIKWDKKSYVLGQKVSKKLFN